MENQARLKEIYDEAGRPGASAFRFAVRRSGLTISENEAKAFVAAQSQGQIFRQKMPSDGKIPSGGKDSARAQADLIDFSKRIEKLKGSPKYVLMVVDLYDRQLFTVPMRTKTAQETLTAWRRVIRANGGITFAETTTDQGNEWALLGAEIEAKGGVLRKKDLKQPNSIAVVDRTIAKIKSILSGYSLTSWAESLFCLLPA